MAISTRYQAIDDLPETGVRLAGIAAIYNYLDVLKTAQQNNATLNGGASYNESDMPTREVSYVYALNSIYRDLTQWQNEYPDDETIPQMRQNIREMFPYFMQNEFPQPEDTAAPNFEIADDCIRIDTQNAETKEIIDPLAFDLEPEKLAELNDFMNRLDDFLDKYAPLSKAEESENLPEDLNEASDAETAGADTVESSDNKNTENKNEEFSTAEKESDISIDGSENLKSEPKNGKEQKTLSKRLAVSSDFIRKMQFFITRKMQNRQVYDFRTTEEKSRTFRNGFINHIEDVLKGRTSDDASFSKNIQDFCNFLSNNGMELIWYQEPPYESEFVDHLDTVKDELLGTTPQEFYNTKLPIFLDLCKNLNEFNPKETAALQDMIKEFYASPNKLKLAEAVDEAKRISLELRETDQVKSRVMRAAWNGFMDNPPKARLSPFMQEILLVNEHLNNPNASAETKQKIADHLAADYKPEDYDFEQFKVWNICKQVPQFKPLEKKLFAEIRDLGIPPAKVADLSYDDLSCLLNRAYYARSIIFDDKKGLGIDSDRENCFKELVKNHERELRKSLQSYYQQKFKMQLINDGVAHKKSDARIQRKISAAATKSAEKVISDLKEGKVNRDFNGHHIFALNNIAYFERTTGKHFTEINKNILLINKDFHDLIHMSENNVDKRGKIHPDENIANRTKYIPKKRTLAENGNIIGYIGRALSFAIMPKAGIKAMIDLRSFIYDKEELLENIKVQKRLTRYRRKHNNKYGELTVPHLGLHGLYEYLKNILDPAQEVSMDNQSELQKARELDNMNKQRHAADLKVIDKTPQSPKAPLHTRNSGHLQQWRLSDKRKNSRK